MINYQIITAIEQLNVPLGETQVVTFPNSDLLSQLGCTTSLIEQLQIYSQTGQVSDCRFACEPVKQICLLPEPYWLDWPEGKLLAELRKLLKSPQPSILIDCRLFDLMKPSHRAACQQLLIFLFNQAYSFNDLSLKTSSKDKKRIQNIRIYVEPQQVALFNKIAQQANAVSDGMIEGRRLADIPSDICTPEYVAHTIGQRVKNRSEISITVLDEKDIKAQGFGLLHAVGKGAKNSPRIVILRYEGKAQAPLRAYVGKGVTYDTGGYWLKSGEGMYTMKYDMCGAANTFGLVMAAAKLQLPVNIVGILMLAENMIGPEAMRPSEVATSYSGLTVEINNTDAEGRLVLADGIAYAASLDHGDQKIKYIIDIATLTGAVVKALGYDLTGLMSSHDKLSHQIQQAGEHSRDEVWRLPLDNRLIGQVNSHIADLCNTPPNNAAISSSAAYFLSQFCPVEIPWAHLDVSGTALWRENGYSTASGRPIPLLIQHIINDLEMQHEKNSTDL
ncbi:M17 family metallopeptidase [Providencia sp. Me31A]|uniref:M17 family metallopeptidase n=1 Tax=Providencia sp. Me31A TaxID=3392637 RepID=UPI003D2B608E